MNKNDKIAVYAGSFDPFTNGHLSILKEACEVFDCVYLCIANNSNKKRTVPIDLMEIAILETLKENGIDNCKVERCDGFVADFCKVHDAKYIVRGLRDTTDYLYEENLARINYEVNPDLKTIYFRAENNVISSSMIREFLKYKKDISKYVPKSVSYILSNYT